MTKIANRPHAAPATTAQRLAGRPQHKGSATPAHLCSQPAVPTNPAAANQALRGRPLTHPNPNTGGSSAAGRR